MGDTPLLVAIQLDMVELVGFMLAHGADPTMRHEIHNRTPVETAAYVAKGADPSVYRIAGWFGGRQSAERDRELPDSAASEANHAEVVRILNQWMKR